MDNRRGDEADGRRTRVFPLKPTNLQRDAEYVLPWEYEMVVGSISGLFNNNLLVRERSCGERGRRVVGELPHGQELESG